MEYIDFIVKQSGRNLTLLDSSKIIINKYDHKVARIVFELDDTIPGRFYFAMKNPITGKYTFVPIIKNHIVIGTNISAYPGRWDSILVAVADDYEITEDDIDQSKFTYVCNTFRRIIVRDNFLNETDEEEIENPAFTEMLEALVKAQDRLENASIEAVEAADSAKADRESVAELIDQINDINTSVEELQDYIDAIKAIRNEVRDYKYEVEDVYEESKQILITINARLDSVEELASEVATNKAHVQEAVNTFNQSYNDRLAEMQNAFDEYIADVNKAQTDAITEITDVGKDIKADVDKSVDAALIVITTQESNSVEAVNEAKTAAVTAVNTASTTGVKNVSDKETSALAAIEAKQNESKDEIASAKETALADLSTGKDEYVELIDAEKQAAITAVKDSVQNTVDEVAAVKDDAIQGVLDESEVQQNLIAVKTQEALDSIPDTYEEVYEMAREGAEKADAIVCEASGEIIVVNDASDDYLRGLKIYGKTEQKQYSGKNLLPYPYISETYTMNGITFDESNSDGRITISGTSTDRSQSQLQTFYLSPGKYILSQIVSTPDISAFAKLTNSTTTYVDLVNFGTGEQIFEITEDTQVSVSVEVRNSGVTLSNAVIYPMLRLATIEDDTYEPYTGGQPSPNPKYPQELVSKGKWGNLLENIATSQTINGITFTVNKDKSVTVNGTSTDQADLIVNTPILKARQEYFVSGCPSGGGSSTYFIRVATSGSGAYDIGSGSKVSVDSEERVTILIRILGGVTVNNLTFYPMLNYGTTALPYRPYSGQKEVQSGVHGKNLLEINTTGGTDSGITYTCNAEKGSVGINGTATAESWCNLNYTTGKVLPKGKYKIFLADKDGNAVSGVYLRAIVNNKNVAQVLSGSKENNEFEITDDTTVDWVRIQIFSGTTVNNAVVYPMIVRAEETDFTFEPYKAKQPLTSLVGNGLDGIEVSDPSLATYTDKDGKMYCADYKDYGRFVNVQRIGSYTFDGSAEGWSDWDSSDSVLKVWTSVLDTLAPNNSVAMCNSFIYGSVVNTFSISSGTHKTCFRVNKTNFATVSDWTTWLSKNPVTVDYILAEPIETPMSDEEIASFKALRSNSPTTTLMNDCDCFSSLSYNADTKTYIKNNTPEPSEESITSAVNAYLDENPVSMVETDPTVPAWAKQATKPSYTATEVGADASGTAASLISSHNVNTESHNDLRILLSELSEKVTTLLNSDDTTLDQTKEIVDYIKANRELIESVTTEKVNVTDIINNLTTNISTKVLSAAQGVALKLLIDDITEALNAHNHDASYGGKTDVENLQADVSALKNIVNTSSITLVDASTGVIYQIVINNGKLTMMEVK